MKKSAVILSGGKNSRMNKKTKAFLKFEDKSFLELELNAIRMFDEIVISCNEKDLYRDLGYKLVEDEIKDIGPLGGIYTSLKETKYDEVLFIPSDMPFLDEEFIKKIYESKINKDALIVRVNGNIEPLCSVYKKSSLEKIEKMIKEKNYKLKDLINNLSVEYLDLKDTKKVRNINTLEEYENLLRK